MSSERPDIPVGLTHTATLQVTADHTVPAFAPSWDGFVDMPPVFATAVMIGFVEQTCIEALRPYLTSEQRTVGTHVNISHLAPTVIGATVTVTVELMAVEQRILHFAVSCKDDKAVIGEGTHQRAIIDYVRFMQRIGM